MSNFYPSESSEALAYWGNLVSLNDEQNYNSPGLRHLNGALYDFANETTKFRSPTLPSGEVGPFVSPEMMLEVLSIQLEITILPFNDTESQATNIHTLDAAFVCIYNLFGIKFLLGTRKEGSSLRKTPMILRGNMYDFLDFFINVDPDGLHRRFNTLLSGPKTLYDPSTDKPFKYKSIPRQCFPAAAHGQTLAFWNQILDRMMKEKAEIIRIGNENGKMAQMEEMQEMQNMSNVYESVQQAGVWQQRAAQDRADNYRATMGGWQYDANGNRTYVQGWM